VSKDPSELCVIVIDDQLPMRKIIKTVLLSLGVNIVLEAADGSDGLREIQRRNKTSYENRPDPNKPREHPSNRRIDFVICDWRMPKLTGIEVLKAIRADIQLRSLTFFMLTAEDSKEQVMEAVQYGVNDYIVKPFTTDALEKKLRSAISK
jgi:two-component system chemotaxis response regulator CheY